VTQGKCYLSCVTGCNQFGPVFWQLLCKPVRTGLLCFFAVFCSSGPVFWQFPLLETGLGPVFPKKGKKNRTGPDFKALYASGPFACTG
jgi:hypothetical protein